MNIKDAGKNAGWVALGFGVIALGVSYAFPPVGVGLTVAKIVGIGGVAVGLLGIAAADSKDGFCEDPILK